MSSSPGVSRSVRCRPRNSPQALRQRWLTEELLALESKTLRPKMELAVELFPLPVFPSKTSRISVEEGDGFLPEETKKEDGYV